METGKGTGPRVSHYHARVPVKVTNFLSQNVFLSSGSAGFPVGSQAQCTGAGRQWGRTSWGRRSVGQNVVGQDVTGAISLGQNVVGQEVSGAGRRGAELRGAGRHWGNIPGAERRGAGGQWGRTSWGRTSWGRTSLGQFPWGRRSVGQDVLGQEVGNPSRGVYASFIMLWLYSKFDESVIYAVIEVFFHFH